MARLGPTLIERTRQAMKQDDAGAIHQATSDLKVAAQALAQHLHGQGGQPGGGGGGRTGPGGDGQSGSKEDVIDAEFEVKK